MVFSDTENSGLLQGYSNSRSLPRRPYTLLTESSSIQKLTLFGAMLYNIGVILQDIVWSWLIVMCGLIVEYTLVVVVMEVNYV